MNQKKIDKIILIDLAVGIYQMAMTNKEEVKEEKEHDVYKSM